MIPPAPPYAFVEGALDRADALREDPAALRRLWDDARLLLLDPDGHVLVDAAGDLFAPRPGELQALLAGVDVDGLFDAAVFLGLRAGRAWFAASATLAPHGMARTDLRSAAAAWPAYASTAFSQARAVLHWRARHRHCAACGTPLAFSRAGWVGHCAPCALEHYPRTDPAVIVAVSDGERLLLGRQANWPARRYSTIAGFVEPGETLEQAVAREVLEETGVRVLDSRYRASQPWPFPGSLMLGFTALAEPDAPCAGDELEDARWFTRAEVGAALRGDTVADGLLLPPSLSISRWLVEAWHGAARDRAAQPRHDLSAPGDRD